MHKHCKRGEKQVEQEAGENLRITLLTNTINISKQDDNL